MKELRKKWAIVDVDWVADPQYLSPEDCRRRDAGGLTAQSGGLVQVDTPLSRALQDDRRL